MCILAIIWLHSNPGLLLWRPDGCVFRYDCGVNVISYLQTPATCTNRAVHAQAMFFTSLEHQAEGSSGASQGAHTHNSFLLNILLVATTLLDVIRHQIYQDTSNRRTVTKKTSLSFLSQLHMNQSMWTRLLTSSLLGYEKDDFHSCLVESQGPSPWRVLRILSDSRLCLLKIAGRWLFLYFHFSCFSRCLAALIVDAWISVIARMLYTCSAKVHVRAQWARANSLDTTAVCSLRMHVSCVKPQRPRAGIAQGLPIPSDSLQQDLLAMLFPIKGKLPLDHACFFIHFRDLWCTASRGMWAISGWGRYWWYHTAAGWLTQPHQRLPPCCKAGRSKRSLAPSLSSLLLRLKPIFVESLRICSGGVEVYAHSAVCQIFLEENSLWQKRRDSFETEIIVKCFGRTHYSSSVKALCDTVVERSPTDFCRKKNKVPFYVQWQYIFLM